MLYLSRDCKFFWKFLEIQNSNYRGNSTLQLPARRADITGGIGLCVAVADATDENPTDSARFAERRQRAAERIAHLTLQRVGPVGKCQPSSDTGQSAAAQNTTGGGGGG